MRSTVQSQNKGFLSSWVCGLPGWKTKPYTRGVCGKAQSCPLSRLSNHKNAVRDLKAFDCQGLTLSGSAWYILIYTFMARPVRACSFFPVCLHLKVALGAANSSQRSSDLSHAQYAMLETVWMQV